MAAAELFKTYVLDQWRTILTTAPVPFAMSIIVVGLLIGFAMMWGYGRELSFVQSQLSEYREKLKGASPDQAAQRIADLERQVSDLTANRWQPLTADEKQSLRAELRSMSPPQQKMQVLCNLAGCGDLAMSFKDVFGDLLKWKSDVVGAYGTDGPPAGIELWYRDDPILKLAGAIERATKGRLKVSTQRFNRDDQINLAIGYKP